MGKKRDKAKVRIHVVMTEDMVAELRQMAIEGEAPMSYIIRRVLSKGIRAIYSDSTLIT